MLIPLLAHTDRPLAPHDLWSAWNFHPLVTTALLLSLVAVVGATARRRDRRALREAALALAGIAMLAGALVSPLDALANSLASAHMVQHLVLTVVAAPLLVLSAPMRSFALGIPAGLSHRIRRHGRTALARTASRQLAEPLVVFVIYALVLWVWHSAKLYDAAVASAFVHAIEHVSFLGAALLFWSVVVSAHRGRRQSHGTAVLLVFATALHTVVLAALLTFAPVPWYSAYATTAATWGLQPLADQQLAGAIMWVPGGLVFAATALLLMAAWIRSATGDGDRRRVKPGAAISAGPASQYSPLPPSDPARSPEAAP